MFVWTNIQLLVKTNDSASDFTIRHFACKRSVAVDQADEKETDMFLRTRVTAANVPSHFAAATADVETSLRCAVCCTRQLQPF